MIVEAINTDFSDRAKSILNISYQRQYEYIDKNGDTQYDNSYTNLFIADIPEVYETIDCLCNIHYSTKQPLYTIDIVIDRKYDYRYMIDSSNKDLIKLIFKRLKNNQDCWLEDIKEAMPEVLV